MLLQLVGSSIDKLPVCEGLGLTITDIKGCAVLANEDTFHFGN